MPWGGSIIERINKEMEKKCFNFLIYQKIHFDVLLFSLSYIYKYGNQNKSDAGTDFHLLKLQLTDTINTSVSTLLLRPNQ